METSNSGSAANTALVDLVTAISCVTLIVAFKTIPIQDLHEYCYVAVMATGVISLCLSVGVFLVDVTEHESDTCAVVGALGIMNVLLAFFTVDYLNLSLAISLVILMAQLTAALLLAAHAAKVVGFFRFLKIILVGLFIVFTIASMTRGNDD